MTEHRIESTDTGLAIHLTGFGDRQAQLLESFGECQAGHCSCPTDEYEKVAEMTVDAANDRIDIRLQPKPGTQLDQTEIEACLSYVEGAS